MNIEIIKLVISAATPIIVLILGLVISKKLEKNKLDVLKEKEWKIRWAELFLNQALEFNKHASCIICSLSNLYNTNKQKEIDELVLQLSNSIFKLSEIEWHIRSYVQFAEKNKDNLLAKQSQLFSLLSKLVQDKKGDIEIIGKVQLEYNQLVRLTHNEIMTIKSTVPNLVR